MKRFLLLLALCLLACESPTHAFRLPPNRPINGQVQKSTYIFVGVVKRLVVTDGRGEVRADTGFIDPHTSVTFDVAVEEALLPEKWKPASTVRVLYRGGNSNVDAIKQQYLGKRLIYLTTLDFMGRDSPIFVEANPSPFVLTVELEQKNEIKALIQANRDEARKATSIEWVAKCISEIEKIKPGTDLGSVNLLFKRLSFTAGNTIVKYAHRDCPFLVFDVEYNPTIFKDARRINTVKSVSKPRLEWPTPSALKEVQ